MEPVTRADIDRVVELLGFDEMRARWHIQQQRELAKRAEQQRHEAAEKCRQRWAASLLAEEKTDA